MAVVDQALCIGCGICTDMCPDGFVMSDDGKAQAIKSECASCSLEEVASACPVEAIQV